MLTKRIIPCLDVKDGRVVKGVNFVSLRDAGDPVECAKTYNASGADELVFLDITATIESRGTTVEMARRVANEVFIPFTIGGGIRTVEDIRELLNAGADKVSLNSAAVKNPGFIKEASKFDFSKLRKYSPEFIAGFLAERYTVGLDEGWDIAKTQIKRTLDSEISSMEKKKRGADRVDKLNFNTAYSKVTYKYVLAPIWIANFKFKEKVYNIVINGQTGQIKGEAPVSPLKVAVAIILAIIAIIVVYALLNY